MLALNSINPFTDKIFTQVVYAQSIICPGEWNLHKTFWDFEIKIDHVISARLPELEIVNKKRKENLPNSGLYRPGRSQSKIKRKRKKK